VEEAIGTPALWKATTQAPQKGKLEFAFYPAIPLPGLDPRELKTGVQPKACAAFIAVRQPKDGNNACPPVGECMTKCEESSENVKLGHRAQDKKGPVL
jgi:hypothetical protein